MPAARAVKITAYKEAVVTKSNGDIFLKRVVRHKNGRSSVKNKRIACGVPAVKCEASIKVVATMIGNAVPAATQTTTERKRLKRSGKAPAPRPTAAAPTVRERIHTFSSKEKADGSFVTSIKPAYIDTTNRVPSILRRARARNGAHVESFQRDFELVAAGMRSPAMEVSTGGQALPLPLAQIQAQDRLKELQRDYPQSYLICKLVLVDSVTPAAIPVPDKMRKKGGINAMIQTAVEDLAGFYTPRRTRPDYSLIAFAEEVDRYKREAGA